MNQAAVWLSVTIMIIILGAWAIWVWYQRDKLRSIEAAAEWKRLLEPNRDGDLIPHTPPDVIAERPLLPNDYRMWSK